MRVNYDDIFIIKIPVLRLARRALAVWPTRPTRPVFSFHFRRGVPSGSADPPLKQSSRRELVFRIVSCLPSSGAVQRARHLRRRRRRRRSCHLAAARGRWRPREST